VKPNDEEESKSVVPKSTKENKKPNERPLTATKLPTSKKPSIVPRETKASQLLKKKNHDKESKNEISVEIKKKPVKNKVYEMDSKIIGGNEEEEVKMNKTTPAKRQTMKPKMHPNVASIK
jgi:hypothetical protein